MKEFNFMRKHVLNMIWFLKMIDQFTEHDHICGHV